MADSWEGYKVVSTSENLNLVEGGRFVCVGLQLGYFLSSAFFPHFFGVAPKLDHRAWGQTNKKTMFPGMFMRKPDKAAALKQLRVHVGMFGAWVAVIRITPYLLHYLTAEKEELKLEF
ncbi:hypothetical protein Ddye_003805 [Dipteronia dyeriana]|uniref:Uncharacterized protein n=1 Tax=Dipteronia dyeriana TaxID=168575 RepID=A0AAE0CVQ6_9ROSI|nr:hypothetical protein Ddye_003805 [Dipteronia dyeriana]